MADIRQLTDPADLQAAFPLMRELRTHLTLEAYMALLAEAMPTGYRLYALEEEGRFRALAGLVVLTNLFDGRHLWLHDLVTDARDRSRGYGARLLSFVEDLARQEGCTRVVLASGLQREAAHRFYEAKMGYQRTSYVFRKRL